MSLLYFPVLHLQVTDPSSVCEQAAAVLVDNRHLLCRHEAGLHASLYDVSLETLLHFAAAFEGLVAAAQSQGASGDEPALLALVPSHSARSARVTAVLMRTNASTS